jgi:hypothetical protein
MALWRRDLTYGDLIHHSDRGSQGGINRSSQHPATEASKMGVGKKQQSIRAMRGHMWSPGRPSTARREDRVRFWKAIARGVSTDNAAVQAGVSCAVGARWWYAADFTSSN